MRPSSATISLFLQGSSVAMFGVIAVWASTSHRHWWIRTGVVVAMLFAVLLVPAHELFITYAGLVIVVLVGVAGWRWREQRALGESTRSQLSLASIFLVTLLIAVLCAVAPGFSSLSLQTWVNRSRDGLLAGGLCLLALWLVCSCRSWFVRVFCGATGLLVLATIQAAFWYVVQFSDPTLVDANRRMAQFWWPRWIITMSFTLIGLCLAWRLSQGAGWLRLNARQTGDMRNHAGIQGALCVILCALAFAPPLLVFWKLVFPPAIPEIAHAVPNAYDQVADLGQLVSLPADANVTAADHDELDRMAIHWQHALDQLPKTFAAAAQVPVNYREELEPRRWSETRMVMAALLGEIRLAVFEADSQRATDALLHLAVVEEVLGRGVTRQEFDSKWAYLRVIDFPPLLKVLAAADALRLSRGLADLDSKTERLSDIERRQAVRAAHGGDWRGRARQIIADLSGESETSKAQFAFRYQLRGTIVRSWSVAAAVRAYWLTHDALPPSLTTLVPEYIQQIPANPFETGPAIMYQRIGESSFSLSITPALSPSVGLPLTPVEFRFDFSD